MLWAFVPIAALLTIVPGAATAMVVRSAMRGGWRAGVATIAGNEIGVVAWALLSVLGISALVAASEIAFLVLKVVGALVLVWLGVQSWRGSSHAMLRPARRPLRDGVVTSLANPKLAVFFVALFPQFVPEHHAALPLAVAMAAIIVALDIVWYSTLAWLVGRARTAFTAGPWLRRTQRLTGCVLVGLGVRLAFETR